jgi:hypothetical protein
MKSIRTKLKAAMLLTICPVMLFTISVSAQTLIHRYSFSDTPGSSTFIDSIGGANGTLQQGLSANPNSAYLDGSQLQLDGTGGYGLVPAGLISSNTQVAIEFWVSYSNNPVWTRTFAFGDQTGGGGQNSGLDYTHFAGGNYQNLNIQTNTSPNTYVNNPAGLNGQANVHVTVVVDPVNNQMYYYNNTALTSSGLQGAAVVFPLNHLNDVYGLIGRSLYDVDATLAASISEFRIYSGTLSVSNIVLNDAAGPNSVVTSPGGPLSAIHLISPANPLVVGQVSQQLLKGDFPNVNGVDLLAYGTNGGSTASFTSGNAAILTVNPTNGLVAAVGAGATMVIANYGSFSATNLLTVTVVPATLTHRYSFATDASDSIGGANGTLNGTASVTGGQLVLDGAAGSYLDLPGAAINIRTNSAITLEAWTTVDAGNGTWARLFEFGNGTGGADLYCAPQINGAANNDHRSISENYGSGSQTIDQAPTWDGTTTHHVWVIDPNTSRLESYVNGVLEYSVQNATAAISNIATNVAWLGRSPFADPYVTGSINEFRIYSGALTPQEIAVTDLSGPNNTNRAPGSLASISVPSMTVPAFSGLFAPTVLANYANLTGFSLIPNSSAPSVVGLVLTSSDTSILTFTGNNMLRTFRPGVVTLTATFQGKTASGTITVQNKGTLTHRYSFTSDASDSVGTANGTNNGAALETAGQLVLDGSANTYVNLPSNLLNSYDSVTVDTWVTLNAGATWARLWFFGDNQNNEFYMAPNTVGGTAHRIGSGVRDGRTADDAPAWQNQTIHITTVYGNGSLELYSNSVPVRTFNNIIGPLSQVGQSLAWIGRSPYADPFMNCSVDEFRIYKGRLSAEEITASDVLGPNQLLTTNVAVNIAQTGGNVVLSWPVAAAGFSLQSRSNLVSGSWVTLTNAPALLGNTNWQITLPASGGQQFYRLWR